MSQPNSPVAISQNTSNALSRLAEALVLHQSGRLCEAEKSYLDIIGTDPFEPTALFYLANLYASQDRRPLAAEFFERAVAVCPNEPQIHNNRGCNLSAMGELSAAILSFERALSLDSSYSAAYYNKANALKQCGKTREACASYESALKCNPQYPDALNNLGNALKDLGEFERATSCLLKALEMRPNHYETLYGLGVVQHMLHDFQSALCSYNRVIELNPDYAEAYWNKAILYLMHGHYLEGWRLFDWRLRMPGASTKYSFFDKPDWRGEEDISDKRLFIPSEQGLGDLIQFSRYAAMAVERAGEVILEVPKMLVPVIRTLHPEITLSIKGQKPPEFDVYCPVMSLPYAFRTTLETIPTNGKYLSSDGQKVSLWQEALGPTDKKRVGLVWSGSPKHENDHNRSIPLTELVPLLSDSVEWHSLQKEYRETDLAVLESMPQVSQHQDALVDFSDTAALIECLDLVITVDTSVAHLAGALGKPVWIMLPHVPDYRWLTDRDDSPWYDSVRLYRQQTSGDWSSVTDQIMSDLKS